MNTATSTAATAERAADEMASRRPGRRILLLGTHGQANIGDELLLETFLQQLGRQHRYTINSYAPDETRASLHDRFEVEVVDTATTRLALLGHIRDSDVVVFGGGSVVKELYESVGRWRYSTLVMVLGVVLAARLMRRPVLLCGVGVGPLPTRTGRALAGAIVRSASLVSVRDRSSYATCKRVGARPGRLVQIPDVVFVNEPDRFVDGVDEPSSRLPAGTGRLRIALNLNRDIANGERWIAFLAELGEALDLVARQTAIEVHALPMQSRCKDDDDLSVLTAFLAERPTWHPIIHTPDDHHDVAAVVTDCDVVVSERLHALVIAAVLGRPVVGLCYDVKVTELVQQLGVAERSFDVNVGVPAEALADAIAWTADRRRDEGDRLRRRAASQRGVLSDHFDRVRRWLDDPSATTWADTDSRSLR